MTTDELTEQVAAKRSFGKAVCQRMTENIVKLGFPVQTKLSLPDFDNAQFSVVIDPFTQSQDLVGYWYSASQQRVGQIKFHGDGSFYAEYDVVQPHPTKKRWFVEAINAWGQQDNIKTEAKLLDIPE